MSNILDLFAKIEKKTDTSPIEFAVVGLGNPGDEYRFTRHNAGFTALDYLSEFLGIEIKKLKFCGLLGDGVIGGKRVVFVKPQTFMNNSGECVRAVCDFYKIPPERTLVIFDDISLDVGKMRIRKNGSAGGHNGIKSLIAHLGSENFPRIKLGVGQKPSPEADLAGHVLGKFPKDEQEKLFAVLQNLPDAVSLILNGDFDSAQRKYN